MSGGFLPGAKPSRSLFGSWAQRERRTSAARGALYLPLRSLRHVPNREIAGKAPWPQAKRSGDGPTDQSRCRRGTFYRAQHRPGLGAGGPRPDLGADEKVLLILAVAAWLASRGREAPLRRAGNHAVLVTVAATLLPMV